jgi:hypothetical protein
MKKPQRVKRERTEKFNILLAEADIGAIKEFAKTQADNPYITESVRRIVRRWLTENGYATGRGTSERESQ